MPTKKQSEKLDAAEQHLKSELQFLELDLEGKISQLAMARSKLALYISDRIHDKTWTELPEISYKLTRIDDHMGGLKQAVKVLEERRTHDPWGRKP